MACNKVEMFTSKVIERVFNDLRGKHQVGDGFVGADSVRVEGCFFTCISHQLMHILGIGIASSPQDRPKTSFRSGTDHPKIPRVSLPMNPLNGTGVLIFSEFQHLCRYIPETVRDGTMGIERNE